MCSLDLWPNYMENYYEGDLSDVVRASATTGTSSSSSSLSSDHHHCRQFSSSSSDHPYPIINLSAVMEGPIRGSNFGDPFSYMRDPFHQLHHIPAASDFSYLDAATNNSAEILITTSTTIATAGGMEEAAGFGGIGDGTNTVNSVLGHKINLQEDDMRRPCHYDNNIFSTLIHQISDPNANLPALPQDLPAATSAIKPPDASEDCGLRISPSWNPGLKRRKREVKKVVCIPAPAAANSRSSGEVVPSDLWAWRKYGQKPIKGSPYPRGYYRCSSSKGCSARKQVERSKTDPNMLVITYTSEHNHQWPTQRNALAGSTRSHASKTHHNNNTKNSDLKQQKIVVAENSAKRSSASMKEEMDQEGVMMIEKKQADHKMMDGGDQFFAELGELIEADPGYPDLNLLFSQGFDDADDDHDDQLTESKALDDPVFHDLFDWSSADNSTTLFQQPRRGGLGSSPYF